MRKLVDLLENINVRSIEGSEEMSVKDIVFDSRKAKEGALFVAIKGFTMDGHDFIDKVLEQGCKVIVSEKEVKTDLEEVTVILVENTSAALAELAANFYGNPSKEIQLVGITGTNGKTTTATLSHDLFTKLGYKCGLLSTVVNKIGKEDIPSTHTTPDPVSLNALLAEMVEEGCSHCFMEVSSHAIHQNRIHALDFTGAVFTNISHDHLDYHKTFKEYIHVKKSFFDHLSKGAFALTNADDKNGSVMLQNTSATKYTYALKTQADFKVKVLENQFSGLTLNLCGAEFWSKLIGQFNAYNLVTVYAIAELLGEDKLEIFTALSSLESVDGRFQYVTSNGGVTGIVDYAHTPDAL